MNTERELLVDCLGRLNGLAIPYMLTGSMASNYWGIPRSTHDLDFVISLGRESIPDLVAAFEGDFFIQRLSVESALRPPHQFNALDQRSALKADFWILQDLPFERQMFARRVSASVFGAHAWIATAEDVILHKLYWHTITPSDRQLSDAAGVFSIQSDALDREHIERWAVALGVQREWHDIAALKIRPKST